MVLFELYLHYLHEKLVYSALYLTNCKSFDNDNLSCSMEIDNRQKKVETIL